MSFDVDEEILQDFLVEAGEILELLSEQLVDLEKDPENSELLNAIFRGFHTVKGGAGFLSMSNLVDVCHGAENVFDTLRTGKRAVSSELMDVILEALDNVNDMFAQIQSEQMPDAAPAPLLNQLHELSKAESESPAPTPTPELTPEPSSALEPSKLGTDDITDDEFEQLLDELHGGASDAGLEVTAPVLSDSGDITDDEFERLLDELHGQGSHSSNQSEELIKSDKPEALSQGNSDVIQDDEFDKLLDELHGVGKGPNVTGGDKKESIAPNSVSSPKRKEAVVKTKSVIKKPEVKKAVVDPAKVASAPAPAPAPAPKVVEATVRVDTKTLDVIMNMVGELVLVRNRLVSLGINSNDEDLTKAVSNLDVVTADLQGAVMKTRMQPIKKVFGRFPRVVRDLARTLKKDISLELEGEETDLDKNLVEALADPLVHLVRNSVDHGIEMPDEREAKGKPRKGIITLSASQEGDHILLTIDDDGAGMDAEKLKSIAVERGVMDQDAAARLSNKEAYNLIFAPGFSTKTEISDISGRGVGMDVVKTGITQLNGTINIDSELGKGTRLEIKVPLTLAILPTLMVEVGKQSFALPLTSVNEIFHLDLSKTNVVDGQKTVIVRERAIPIFYLQDWLVSNGSDYERPTQGHVVIVQIGSQQVGFVVDALIGQEEVVIKALDHLLQGTPGMAGATITSDGGIALILDIPSMLKRYARKTI